METYLVQQIVHMQNYHQIYNTCTLENDLLTAMHPESVFVLAAFNLHAI